MRHQDYTVGWICALPTELAAAQAMLDERHNGLEQDPYDHNAYIYGRIGVHNVVLACLPSGVTGTISAARVATQMLYSFKSLRFGLMVGIGGGVPSEENDIRLGDIVVSKPVGTFGGVIQFDYGKTIQEGRFFRTGSLNRPPDVLLTALAALQAKHLMEGQEFSNYLSQMVTRYPNMEALFAHPGMQHDWLYKAEYDHPRGNITCSQCDRNRLVNREPRSSVVPAIHYGLIASGDQVMRHGTTRDQLRRELDVLCFEMEAAGLIDSFRCLVIRGICDYADSHKNKRWQGYAAATAAAYTKELLCLIPGNQVIGAQTAAEVKVLPST
jgi:nucleoside phosphorylase